MPNTPQPVPDQNSRPSEELEILDGGKGPKGYSSPRGEKMDSTEGEPTDDESDEESE